MKKIVSVVLAALMAASLFGCAKKEEISEEPIKTDPGTEAMIQWLPEMHENLSVGTAGSSITSAVYAARLADLLSEHALSAELVKGVTEEYVGDAVVDANQKALFAEQAASVRDSFLSLMENGTDIVEENGYTPRSEAWDAETLTPLFAALTQGAASGAYAPVLEKYYGAISEKSDPEKLMEEDLNYMVNDCSGDKGLDGAGYRIEDLDGDGIAELMIGTIAGDDFCGKMILELYRVNEYGDAERVFTSGERDRYYYAGENQFAHIGSSSAFDSFDTTEAYQNGEMQDLNRVTEKYVQADLLPFSAYREN